MTVQANYGGYPSHSHHGVNLGVHIPDQNIGNSNQSNLNTIQVNSTNTVPISLLQSSGNGVSNVPFSGSSSGDLHDFFG